MLSLCGLFQPRRTYLRKGHFMEETEAHPPSDLPHRHSGGATHLPYSLGSWDDIEGPPWLGASAHCSELGLTRPCVFPGSQVAAPPPPGPPWSSVLVRPPPPVAVVASSIGLLEGAQDCPPLPQSLPQNPIQGHPLPLGLLFRSQESLLDGRWGFHLR